MRKVLEGWVTIFLQVYKDNSLAPSSLFPILNLLYLSSLLFLYLASIKWVSTLYLLSSSCPSLSESFGRTLPAMFMSLPLVLDLAQPLLPA